MDDFTNKEDEKSGVIRTAEEPDQSRAALIARWKNDIQEAKKHWEKDFKRMINNMEFASGKQWPGQKDDDDRYIANFVQRVIKTTVSQLYAKNPKVVSKRAERLNYRIWDGKMETLQAAIATMEMAIQSGKEVDPQTSELMKDITENGARIASLDKMGKTLEILIQYFIKEQLPGFKSQMKRMIRRARTTGVGYIELDFQREMELSDDQTTKIADMAERLAVIGRLAADLQDGEVDENSAEAEELRLATAAIQAEPDVIVREGPIWNFPLSTRIIPSPETQHLVGWVGAPWIVKEILMTTNRVKEAYGIDVGDQYSRYKVDASSPMSSARSRGKSAKSKDGLVCVWHVFDRDSGLEMVIADGYPDFLIEPSSPSVKVEQFFPVWAITFNEIENEGDLYPKSDVELMTHIQREYNRSKEALRQHRIANRPLYLAPEGQFDEDEQGSLANHAAHDVITLKAMRDGVKPEDLLAPVKKAGIDPNLYETESLFNDMVRVIGTQQAQIGGTAGGTATESSIAQQSTEGSIGLDSDDLDDMLSQVMRATGQVLLLELSAETVAEIVGPGAVWPTLSRLEAIKEISLEIKAGSSGRPNQAQDAAKFERMYPLLVQIPGITPQWLAEIAIKIADDDTKLEDAFLAGLPSILAQNQAMQASTGDPSTDPAAQGGQGGMKAQAGTTGGSAQPGYTQGPQQNQV